MLANAREAQSAIMTDEIPLDDALLQLREFIDENSGEFFVQVWGNGANFDNTILRRSYERQGIPCPWRYYNDRDVRTIVELGKAIDFDLAAAMKQIKELQRLLGKKTMENELLKEAVEYGRAKKWIAHAPLLPGDGE